MSVKFRELTREERAAIHKLVTKYCANYQREYGCLPLDGECYMLLKWWTGAYCRYFKAAVLPLDPALETALTGGDVGMRSCAFCGQLFPANGRQIYCSAACAKKAHRRQQRKPMRKKRR
jgi:hypothetical protein